MSKRLVLLASLLGIVAPFAVASPALAAGRIKITKIHYAQKGNNLNTEYIVFKNTSGSTVQMKGWEIISAPSSDNQHYFFPKTSVPSGGLPHPLHRQWDQLGRQALLGCDLAALGQLR